MGFNLISLRIDAGMGRARWVFAKVTVPFSELPDFQTFIITNQHNY